MEQLDVLIIGGGPIGIACGLEAKKKGLSYVIIEKGPIVNSLFNYPINMQFFSSSERLEIDDIPFISKEAKPKRNEALEYYRRIVTSNNLNIHLFERVEEVIKEDNFKVITDKSTYLAANVIVATGFYDLPNLLNIPGEGLPKVSHYYKDPHFYASQKLAVIGASNSAIDAALECWRKGSEVTLIIRGPEVGKRVKVLGETRYHKPHRGRQYKSLLQGRSNRNKRKRNYHRNSGRHTSFRERLRSGAHRLHAKFCLP